VKKIEAFIRHEAFEPIRIRTGEEGDIVQAPAEKEIAAGAAQDE
jgi:hypothetical protein